MEYINELKESLDKMPTMSQKCLEKKNMFIDILSFNPINLKKLQQLSFNGIPDDLPQLRSIVWKILIGYLPLDKNHWKQTIEKNKESYFGYLKEFVQIQKKENDHPLSNNKDSNWNFFFKDSELYEEIQKDTIRTRSEMHMFVSQVQDPLKVVNVFRKQKKPIMHYEVLSRILFVFAKLNSGIKYVQGFLNIRKGMNELLAPLYFVFQKDKQFLQKNDYEFETFFCFTILMSECKDNFIKSLDQSSQGIKANIQNLNDKLKEIDFELWSHLENEGVNPHFYTLRWLMLYLTQEFKLNDVLRLWDSLLAQDNKQSFLNYLCLAIIINFKDIIMGQEFAYILGKLQRFENIEVLAIIQKAQELIQNEQN